MKYDNTAYWREMHRTFEGSLKAVGISSLSEEYNTLKYSSEGSTIIAILDKLFEHRPKGSEVSVMDVGAGIGYWAGLVERFLLGKELTPAITAVDISQDALDTIRRTKPTVQTTMIDLKEIDADTFREKFDLVIAVYCLHHLVDLKSYLNAVAFAARSVKQGGHLIIVDPILSKPYSRWYSTDWPSFDKHSFPRPLFLLDNAALDEGMKRSDLVNALSFLLAANTESNSRWGYFVQKKLWNLGYYLLYRHDAVVKILKPLIVSLDRFFKTTRFSNGTIAVVYQKC